MRDRIAITCSSDIKYARHSATMLVSAIRNTPDTEIHVYYLHGPDLTADEQGRVRTAVEGQRSGVHLNFVPVPDELVAGLPLFAGMKPGSLRPVMWYRAFLPRLVPHEPKILYIDSDMIVLDDLRKLWSTDLAGQPLAAVSNPFFANNVHRDWPLQLGLPSRKDYFNTGLLLIDLDRFRAEGLAEKILEHGRANAGFIRFGDQDSFSAVLHARRVSLSPRWNLMRTIMLAELSYEIYGAAELRRAIRNPGIVHFEGAFKPWIHPARHPFGRLYTKYARGLPWPVVEERWGLDDIEALMLRRMWFKQYDFMKRWRQRLGLAHAKGAAK
jgi:lipopolysaccharide biosynthesis glycosyltransferase